MGAQSDGSGTPSLRYLTALAEQLAADGCEPRQEQSSAGRVPVARRADFRIQRAVTRLHLLPSPRPFPAVSVSTIEDFTRSAQQYATTTRRPAARLADWHRAILVPGLCESGSGALAWAEARQLVQFAVMARPVAAAVGGVVGAFRRTRFLGGTCAPRLRRKLTLYFGSALQALDGRW